MSVIHRCKGHPAQEIQNIFKHALAGPEKDEPFLIVTVSVQLVPSCCFCGQSNN